MLGNVDMGKSTLLGELIQGQLDNGHARARLNLFRSDLINEAMKIPLVFFLLEFHLNH